MTAVVWNASRVETPARVASWKSMDAVSSGAKAEWLALFSSDACVEDPVGPSMFDASGKGHHGIEAISAFWDLAIGPVERFSFLINDSFAAGFECANVGVISAFLPGGARVDTEGVFVYCVGEDGLIRSVRAFWETERALATLRTP